jgi:hypothetical protein
MPDLDHLPGRSGHGCQSDHFSVPSGQGLGIFRLLGLAAVLLILPANSSEACPFCGPVGDSLARRRDTAGFVCIAEAEDRARPDASGLLAGTFRVIQVLPDTAGRIDGKPPTLVTARVAAPVEGTAVLFGSTDSPPRWTAVAADETLLGHVVTAPAITEPVGERLAWFAARLEHPEPAIADDAFAEFAVAPFPAVREAAAALAARPLEGWVADPATDQRRRGFYGLALGIVVAEGSPGGTRLSSAPLRTALETAGGDFRAGADGLMAGILVADGSEGLDWLVDRAGTDRPVDQRQLLAALRFAREYLTGTIPPARISSVTAELAQSPAVAALAIIDLARAEAWDAVDAVAGWWDAAADDPLIRRAVAGYLVACPSAAARDHLERIGREDPAGLAAARAAADLPLGR